MAFAHRVSYELRCYSQVSSKIIHVPLRSWATFKSQHLTLSRFYCTFIPYRISHHSPITSYKKGLPLGKALNYLEPITGFEPATYSLRMNRSTS